MSTYGEPWVPSQDCGKEPDWCWSHEGRVSDSNGRTIAYTETYEQAEHIARCVNVCRGWGSIEFEILDSMKNRR